MEKSEGATANRCMPDATKARRLPDCAIAFLISLVLVTTVFFDALFLRASLSHTSNYISWEKLVVIKEDKTRAIALLPQPAHRVWNDAFLDNGGALWQSEPMMHFMRFCLAKHESPYWNPFSAAGQLGPETLVDLKFSLNTVLNALAGGSQLAFNLILICSYYVSTFCLSLLMLGFLRTSVLACVVACIVYLLNGYNTATLATNTSLTYVYFPIHLLALFSFSNNPSLLKFALLGIANAIVFSVTFLPTTFLMLVSNHVLATGFLLWQTVEKRKNIVSLLTVNACYWIAAGLLGFACLSIVYFPMIESFQVVNPFSMYSSRTFHAANLNGLLSLFTPKHFWEEYNAIPPYLQGRLEDPGFHVTNAMHHMGLISLLLSSALFVELKSRRGPLYIACLALIVVSLGRIFNVAIISDLVGILPGFKSLGEQYWFAMAAISLPVAAGLGFDALKNAQARVWIPLLSIYALVGIAVLNNYIGFGSATRLREYSILCLIFFGCIVVLSAVLIALYRQKSWYGWQAALTLLVLAELSVYTSSVRYKRNDFFLSKTPAISFLKEHCGNYRVANFNRGFLSPEHGAAFQIQQIESLNMNILPSYERLFAEAFLKDPETRWGIFPTLFKHQDRNQFSMDFLNFLGAKYIVLLTAWTEHPRILKENGCKDVYKQIDWTIFENKQVYPRMFATEAIASDIAPFIDFRQARTTTFTNDSSILEESKRLGIRSGGRSPRKLSDDCVAILEYHNDYIKARATLEDPAIVVLTDNYHPNWQATIDGKKAALGVVDRSFRGVAVPQGEHLIEMRYSPRTLPIAQIVSSGSALLLLAMLLIGGWRDVQITKRWRKNGSAVIIDEQSDENVISNGAEEEVLAKS